MTIYFGLAPLALAFIRFLSSQTFFCVKLIRTLSLHIYHWVCVTKRCELFTWTLNFAWYDVEQMSAVSSGLFSSEKLSTTTLLSDFKLSRTFMTIEVPSKGDTLEEFQAWCWLQVCCSGPNCYYSHHYCDVVKTFRFQTLVHIHNYRTFEQE